MPSIATLRKEGESSSVALARLATGLVGVNQVIDAIGLGKLSTSVDGAGAAQRLLDLTGGLEKFTQGASFFAENFLSEAEKMKPAIDLVAETMARYGRLTLHTHPTHGLVLQANDRSVLEEVLRSKKVAPLVGARIDPDTVAVHPSERGHIKQVLLKLGWPAEDLAGYVDGEAHPIALRTDGWKLRGYQREAAEGFWHGGSGVVVLPCGAGKTLVGAAAMAHAQATTLILVTNTVSARQWKDELLRRTSLTEEEIGEYSGAVKEIRPVTIATYQVLTTKRKGVYPHLELLDARDQCFDL